MKYRKYLRFQHFFVMGQVSLKYLIQLKYMDDTGQQSFKVIWYTGNTR